MTTKNNNVPGTRCLVPYYIVVDFATQHCSGLYEKQYSTLQCHDELLVGRFYH